MKSRIALCLALGMAFAGPIAAIAAPPHDLVIRGGRVMDPETGLDAVRHLGLRDGRIAAVSETPLDGRQILEAHGLVVAPGFIDLHQHAFEPEALRAKVRDGVTTAVDMELGALDVPAWYAELEGRAQIHYGTSVAHGFARVKMLTGIDPGQVLPSGDGANRVATDEEIAAMRAVLRTGLSAGALGVGLVPEYTPGATPWELLEMFRTAGEFRGAPVHVHVRSTERPQHWMETAELLMGTLVSGAPLHIVHANSSYGGDAPKLLAIIDAARSRGLDVTTEVYPYIASATLIESAPFDDWQEWKDEEFTRLIWPATGERLTRESFTGFRAQGGLVVIEGGSEAKLRPVLESPLAMIVSDGGLLNGSAHPRIAGSYARVLGKYVREEGVLTLMEALRKMTLMPAQRLEARAPGMRRKGRIAVGMDADLTIFDPATIIDRATFSQPLLPSAGIVHVLVAGEPVLVGGELREGVMPGRAIRASE